MGPVPGLEHRHGGGRRQELGVGRRSDGAAIAGVGPGMRAAVHDQKRGAVRRLRKQGRWPAARAVASSRKDSSVQLPGPMTVRRTSQ